MTWVMPARSVATWTSQSETAKSYIAVHPTLRSWTMVSRQVEGTDGGVDFELRLHESYPWLIAEIQSNRILSSGFSEGRP